MKPIRTAPLSGLVAVIGCTGRSKIPPRSRVDEEERLAKFREVRDGIEKKLKEWLAEQS